MRKLLKFLLLHLFAELCGIIKEIFSQRKKKKQVNSLNLKTENAPLLWCISNTLPRKRKEKLRSIISLNDIKENGWRWNFCPKIQETKDLDGQTASSALLMRKRKLPISICFPFYFLNYLFIFRKRRREGEREGEKHQCARETSISCLLHAPNWGPGLQPRHVPSSTGNLWVWRPAL